LVEKAQAALDTLSKKDFSEAKALTRPPPGVDDITAAVMHIVSGIDPLVPVDKNGRLMDKSWKAAQKMMGNPQNFLENLTKFKAYIDDCSVPAQNFKAVRPLLALEHFDRDIIFNKSRAAAGLCEWVINIVLYYDVISEVEPKRNALREATEQLADANEKLEAVKELVARLQAELQVLVDQFDAAIAEKEAVEAEANRCQKKLDLANRLVNALGSEKDRWGESIENF
jgi:dynein heavy chain